MEPLSLKVSVEVTPEDISKGDTDLENPIAVMWGMKHPELVKEYSKRQYSSESHWGL